MAIGIDYFHERLTELRAPFRSLHEFALKIGVEANLTRKYLGLVPDREPSLPGMENLAKISQNLGVELDWLCYGTGPKYRTGKADDGFLRVRHYAVAASAGHGALVESEDQDRVLMFRSDWVRSALRASSDDLFALKVQGDSMEPEIRDGDTVLVHSGRTNLIDGKIYVITVGDALVIKRSRLTPDGWSANSDNPGGYYPIPLRPEGYIVHGQVVWVGRLVV